MIKKKALLNSHHDQQNYFKKNIGAFWLIGSIKLMLMLILF